MAKYMKNNTLEYYYLGSDSVTISNKNISENLHLLNDAGLELYEKTLLRSDFKGVFPTYQLVCSNSGFWKANPESFFYKEEECKVCLNTFRNYKIYGTLRKENEEGQGEWIDLENIVTSPIIFRNENICLTMSGSLYFLGEEISL